MPTAARSLAMIGCSLILKAASQVALLGSLNYGGDMEIPVELKGIEASHTLASELGQLAGSLGVH